MYLSRVQIDFLNRRKTKDLSHLGAYHNWVESAFRKFERDNERTRKLWRIDTLCGKKYLLILSNEKPDIQALEKYGIENSAQTKSYDKLINSRDFKLLKKSNQRDIRISVVSYEGLLTVTNKDLFINSLILGIGREKAYGCGMITVIEV